MTAIIDSIENKKLIPTILGLKTLQRYILGVLYKMH